MPLELLFPWKCIACGLAHSLKNGVENPRCFKCGGELVPVEPVESGVDWRRGLPPIDN